MVHDDFSSRIASFNRLSPVYATFKWGEKTFMMIALAGRRVDSADAEESRFPVGNVEIVKERTLARFQEMGATMLVSSAACGADLIAQWAANELKFERRRVILPYERQRFRESSVIDRPGDWGPLYDQILDEVEAAGDLIVLQGGPDNETYAAANLAILDHAVELAKGAQQPVKAVLIWEGVSRGADDLTQAFEVEARKRGVRVVTISTL